MRTKSILIFLLCLFACWFIPPHSIHASFPTISYTQLLESTKPIPDEPRALSIPTARIASPIHKLSIVDGKMEVPKSADEVGWYVGGVRPGEKGNAVLAGHRDTKTGEEAVFFKLELLRSNDKIYIKDTHGVTYAFSVQQIQEYPYTEVPLTTLFTKSSTSRLILITCSGDFDTQDNTYSKRLLVTATLVPSE